MTDRFELGNKLALVKVHIDDLIEQEINARVMDNKTYQRLTANVKKRGALEEIPYCAKTEKGIEIVSGHHRVRSLRSAEITETWVLVDESDLTRSEIAAKQLAHNSIAGQDDPEIVKRIYEMIELPDLKLEAHIDEKILEAIKYDTIPLANLDLNFEYKEVNILFLPTQKDKFMDASSVIQAEKDYDIAAYDEYSELIKAMQQIKKFENIRNTATIVTRMSEIVLDYYKNKKKVDKEDGQTTGA